MIKKILFFTVLYFIFFSCFAADTLDVKKNTRNNTIKQFFSSTLVGKAPVLQIFTGVGFRKSRLAYTIVKIEAGTEIFTSKYPLGFFKRFGVYIKTFNNNLKKNPQTAMALLFPWFLIAVLGIASPVFYKSLVVRPVLEEPKKPDNDTSEADD